MKISRQYTTIKDGDIIFAKHLNDEMNEVVRGVNASDDEFLAHKGKEADATSSDATKDKHVSNLQMKTFKDAIDSNATDIATQRADFSSHIAKMADATSDDATKDKHVSNAQLKDFDQRIKVNQLNLAVTDSSLATTSDRLQRLISVVDDEIGRNYTQDAEIDGLQATVTTIISNPNPNINVYIDTITGKMYGFAVANEALHSVELTQGTALNQIPIELFNYALRMDNRLVTTNKDLALAINEVATLQTHTLATTQQNGFTLLANNDVEKYGRLVRLQINTTNATTTINGLVFTTLPAAYRPRVGETIYSICVYTKADDSLGVGKVTIDDNGEIKLWNITNLKTGGDIKFDLTYIA